MIGGFDYQGATVGHRIPGIDHQIEQGTFELAAVSIDRPDVLPQFQDQVDIRAFAAAEQFLQ